MPSVALLFTGFRAIPVPVTGDDPVQNLGAIRRLPWYIVCRQRPLVFAPTDYCKPTGDKAPPKPRTLQTLVLLHIRSIRTCRYYGGDCRGGIRTRDLRVMGPTSYHCYYPAIIPWMLQTLALLHIHSIRACRYYGGDKPYQNRTDACSFGDCRDSTSLKA